MTPESGYILFLAKVLLIVRVVTRFGAGRDVCGQSIKGVGFEVSGFFFCIFCSVFNDSFKKNATTRHLL